MASGLQVTSENRFCAGEPFTDTNDIYLQPYPPFKGNGTHHPTNEHSTPGSLCPGQKPSYLVISLSDACREIEEENKTCPLSLNGCVTPGELQVLTGLSSLICNMRGWSLPGDGEGKFPCDSG